MWSRLPSEIWLIIMRWGDSVESILCLSLSCKKLRILFESEVRKRWTLVLESLHTGQRVIPLEPRVPFYEIANYYRMHRQRDPMKLEQEYMGLLLRMDEMRKLIFSLCCVREECTLSNVAMDQIRVRERQHQTGDILCLLCMCFVPRATMNFVSVMCEYLPKDPGKHIPAFISEASGYLTMALMTCIMKDKEWRFKDVTMGMIKPHLHDLAKRTIHTSDDKLLCLQKYLSHYEIWLALLSPIPSKIK